jgi:thioredoxin 1
MKPLRHAAALLLVTTSLAGCPDASSAPTPARPLAAPSTSPSTAPSTGKRPRLVLFMNPNGRPCLLQDQILRGMAGELESRADLVYFRTTDSNDLAHFEQYGIRSIPQLLVTDQAGAELRRATPGIQSEAQVRQLLGP